MFNFVFYEHPFKKEKKKKRHVLLKFPLDKTIGPEV